MSGNISEKTGIEEIRFGSGGGFTGAVKAYSLSADGQLTEQDDQNGLSKKINTKTTLELFTLAKELKTYSLNEPDNVYSFIEIKSRETTNKIVWAFGSTKADQKVTDLFNQLSSLTK